MSRKPKIKVSQNKAKDVERPPMPSRVVPPNHQQALAFIDDAVAMAPLSRSRHIQTQQALRQIGGAIDELAKLKEAKKE